MSESSSSLAKYPPSLIEAVATHTLLGMLNYTAAEMFLLVQSDGLFVQLQADGKTVDIRVGKPEVTIPEISILWKELVTAWNTGGTVSEQEKDRVYLGSQASKNRAGVIACLLSKGLTLRI